MAIGSRNQVSPVELGQQLASLRRRRNLSQAEVAARLGISRPTLVAVEKGRRAILPAEAVLMAEWYGVSVHELLTRRPAVVDFAPMFRLTDADGADPAAVEAAILKFQSACQDYLALEQMLNAPMPSTAAPETWSFAHLNPQAAAEELAATERMRLGIGIGPVPDLIERIENDASIRVFVLALPDFRIAAMFAFTDRLGGCVLVNGSHPRTRQNWSMAHEYAHYLTDRFRQDVSVLAKHGRRPQHERFADAFAASFLMPAAGVQQQFRRTVQSRGDFTVADLCLLADQYGVSIEAMTRRLESVGCVPAGAWDRIRAQNVDPGKVRSHLGLQAPPAIRQRLPDRYVRLAVQAFEEDRITETELARLLRCERVEAREIVEHVARRIEVGGEGQPYQLDLDILGPFSLAPGSKTA